MMAHIDLGSPSGLAGVKLKLMIVNSTPECQETFERERERVWEETALIEIHPVILLHVTL